MCNINLPGAANQHTRQFFQPSATLEQKDNRCLIMSRRMQNGQKPTRSLVKHNVALPILAKLTASSYYLGPDVLQQRMEGYFKICHEEWKHVYQIIC